MIYAIATVLVLILDQAVKLWTTKNIVLNAVGADCKPLIDGVVHMTNVHNYGAAFGILQDARWPLALVSAVFVIVIIVLLSREVIHTPFGRWTVAMVMAGALGNCIDRVLYGYVVDMFEVEFVNFAVFNVADIFITVCGILFCIHLIFHNEPVEVREANAPEFIRRRKQRKAELAQAAAAAEAAKEPVKESAKEPAAPPTPAPAPLEEPEETWGFGAEAPPAAPPKQQSLWGFDEDFSVPDLETEELWSFGEEVPAAPKKKPTESLADLAPAPAPDERGSGYAIEEFSLEDILAEFGDG